MSCTAAPTDRDDSVSVVRVHALDPHGGSEDFGFKRTGQVLFDHREQPDALLRFPVRVYDRVLDELIESTRGERGDQARTFSS